MKRLTKEMREEFRLHLNEEEKSKNTVEKYMRDVGFFEEWLNGRDIDKGVILEYKNTLCKKYAPSSVNSMLSSLNSLFSFLNWYDLRVKNVKIQKQIFASCEKELSMKEYERLLAVAKKRKNDRLYCLVQTIAGTGIRISELSAITVESVYKGSAVISCKGKMRQVFLPKTLCRMLKDYINRENITGGAVFVTKSGNPLNRNNVWKNLKSLCKEAGVSEEKVFPHNLRHLFARTFYSSEKDIVRLADILGHSSVNTTRIYTMETGEKHKKQIEKLGLVKWEGRSELNV